MGVDGYTLLRVDRNRLNLNGDRMEGGGVAVYIRDGITYSQNGLLQYCVCNDHYEVLWVKIILFNQTNMILQTTKR